MNGPKSNWQRLQHESTVRVPAQEPRALLTAQDFSILKEGPGNSDERTYRDAAIGVFASAVLSVVGFALSVNVEDSDGTPNWSAIACICVAVIVAAVSLAVAAIMWSRLARALGRTSYRDLCERIASDLAATAPGNGTDVDESPSQGSE